MTEIPHDLGAFDAISPGDDVAPMRLALAMGASVRTSTSPNPWVGAVVVAGNGEVVGTGATAPVGGSHAEVNALQQAGDAARGGTLYVTLEPCCHVGRTPPCTDAVIAAGVSRVVIGIVDPDEKVAGNGIAQLKSANIAVDLGVSSEEISEQLRPYIHHRKTARPFVLAKLQPLSMVTPPQRMAPRSGLRVKPPVVMRIDSEQKVMPSSLEPERFAPITHHSPYGMSKDATLFESCWAQRQKKRKSTLVLSGVRRSMNFSMNSSARMPAGAD